MLLLVARRRKLRTRSNVARHRRAVFSAAVGLVAVALLGIAWVVNDQVLAGTTWQSLDELEPVPLERTSVVLAADGSRLGTVPAERHSVPVSLEQVGEWTAEAAVAIEDRRFYEHDGFDAISVARAARRNAQEGRIVEGGSTITQQTVRLLYKEVGDERTMARKAREVVLARELDERWTKRRILISYLNRAYFGHKAHGIEAAARTYFGIPARKLSLAQSALLAGLVQRPSKFDPFADMDAALNRRAQVLGAMLRDGKITTEQHQQALAEPVRLAKQQVYDDKLYPHFFDHAERELVRAVGEQKARYGGLRVKTTIEPKLQQLAGAAITETLNQPGDPSAAIIALDTKTGAVKAMASSATYDDSRFNLATQGLRQPGSSAKTWVLAELVRRGYDPWSVPYSSYPFSLTQEGVTEPWEVRTYDNTYVGSTNVGEASIRSDNSVFAQLTLDLGADTVARTAKALGIVTPIEAVPSIGLGAQAVTVLEQTNFYSSIARGGVRTDPWALASVLDPSGEDLTPKRPAKTRVLQPEKAGAIVQILAENMRRGTGTGAQIGRAAAGKTGTTDAHSDAWFCGMTPELTTCVWMGYSDAMRPMYSVHGIRVAGGTFPATMWGKFMGPALEGTPGSGWTMPTERGRLLSSGFPAGKWRSNPAWQVGGSSSGYDYDSEYDDEYEYDQYE